jgi:hypothetical protein
MKVALYQRIKDRIGKIGIWNTILFAIGVILDKVGVQICYLFGLVGGPLPFDQYDPINASVALSMDSFSDTEQRALCEYGHKGLLRRFGTRFAAGLQCVVLRSLNGELATIGWLIPAPPALCASGMPVIMIEDCFTMPALRGRGLYPMMIQYAVFYLCNSTTFTADRIMMQCSVFNDSSVRGILHSGFDIVGITCLFRRWRSVRFFGTGKRWIRKGRSKDSIACSGR